MSCFFPENSLKYRRVLYAPRRVHVHLGSLSAGRTLCPPSVPPVRGRILSMSFAVLVRLMDSFKCCIFAFTKFNITPWPTPTGRRHGVCSLHRDRVDGLGGRYMRMLLYGILYAFWVPARSTMISKRLIISYLSGKSLTGHPTASISQYMQSIWQSY